MMHYTHKKHFWLLPNKAFQLLVRSSFVFASSNCDWLKLITSLILPNRRYAKTNEDRTTSQNALLNGTWTKNQQPSVWEQPIIYCVQSRRKIAFKISHSIYLTRNEPISIWTNWNFNLKRTNLTRTNFSVCRESGQGCGNRWKAPWQKPPGEKLG